MALEKKITVETPKGDFSFNVSLAAHDKYVNELTMTNKIKPATNFLMNTVEDKQRKDLKEVFQSVPGSALNLCSAVIEEYQPDFDLTVKK